jgi:hypothetical protein
MAGPLIPVGGGDIVGVGLYRLNKDRPNTFVATWYSTNADQPLLGSGLGYGNTANGFCGVHEIRYYRPNGEPTEVPFELTIKPLGEVRELLWTHQGKPCFKGVGIEIGDQLIVSYWRVPGSAS